MTGATKTGDKGVTCAERERSPGEAQFYAKPGGSPYCIFNKFWEAALGYCRSHNSRSEVLGNRLGFRSKRSAGS